MLMPLNRSWLRSSESAQLHQLTTRLAPAAPAATTLRVWKLKWREDSLPCSHAGRQNVAVLPSRAKSSEPHGGVRTSPEKCRCVRVTRHWQAVLHSIAMAAVGNSGHRSYLRIEAQNRAAAVGLLRVQPGRVLDLPGNRVEWAAGQVGGHCIWSLCHPRGASAQHRNWAWLGAWDF